MSFASAIHYVETSHAFGTRLHLHTIHHLLHLLGNPHKQLHILHVAGTNGKGSTSSFLANMLTAEGYRTGLFTSPHMHCYTERIRINGVNIPEEELARIILQIESLITPMVQNGKCQHPAMFDLMTLAAFVYFGNAGLDYVVLEVGLGGLEDATNVIESPLAAVITPIDIDHVDLLGNSLSGIAAHKAGIIKHGRPVIYHHQLPEAETTIRSVAASLSAPLFCLESSHILPINSDLLEQHFHLNHPQYGLQDLHIRMLGDHQMSNAALAALTLLVLRDHGNLTISNEAILRGLLNTHWSGRLEVLHQSPLVIIDGAHNLQGAEILQHFLNTHLSDRKINFLVGMLNNKDIQGVLNTLLPLGHKLFFTRAANSKAVDPLLLAENVQFFGKEVYVVDSLPEAVEAAYLETSMDEVLVITGSLYLVGDAKAALLQFLDRQKEAS
ncbi:bifunctional folylpolyglutamate synthase/dihydrofolate synthase [Anoxynatronum buryatiense]|uniref:tetrahydrofolate synthase n=1 Tax=Anoxynatronum buryatiense TaxID=489973 RepID=A0AA45WSI3_9CLOT|nr:folylpolyglutamate synthase/dihydrofolate synthase family protein [Anoxynatronum buryatiense]SMP38132.1 dihydrofolate synthase / folylpolyglutamate synthase [Anoxynatronum buryatiense]